MNLNSYAEKNARTKQTKFATSLTPQTLSAFDMKKVSFISHIACVKLRQQNQCNYVIRYQKVIIEKHYVSCVHFPLERMD